MMKKKKHLSSIASDVVERCAKQLGTSVDKLVEAFEAEWRPETLGYSRKFVEFCSRKVLSDMCPDMGDNISDGSFSRLTYDMMLAWEMPSSADEEAKAECIGKEKEDRRSIAKASEELDDIPLFYSDIMPLLVDNEPDVGEDAFAWMASLCPLVADVANGRFTFETLTAPTGNRLHFPAYDKFLKEIDKCIKHLQKQETPTGVELDENEFILHVEGTAHSQRVVRHIGGTSWPGRLTLTNYALYFEASGVINYEDALKINLSKDVEHTVKPAATGPWGAPLFDKAMVYESPELPEGIILEFPELTSCTRRDHWLALTKEIMLMHKFLSRFKLENSFQVWETHALTMLCIIRLHAAREMLRISPPLPTKFLIFAQYDELPKGDYVLEELAESVKKDGGRVACSASSILRISDTSRPSVAMEEKEAGKESPSAILPDEDNLSLDTAVNKVREEAKETELAKATTEGLKEDGISDSIAVLMELLKPLKDMMPRVQEIIKWERPAATSSLIVITLIVIYKEWVNKVMAALLAWLVVEMYQARKSNIKDRFSEIIICTAASEQSTMESIVSAQRGVQTVHSILQAINITILKMQSIFVSRPRKHADLVMVAMTGLAILIAVTPLKYVLMGSTLYGFIMTSKIGKQIGNERGNRRLKEWWDSIPVAPIRTVDKAEHCPR